MNPDEPKSVLHHYLTTARDTLVWKLEGLSEYDVRRPLTPTGTNLLGLLKHLSGCEIGYFGDTFGRPFAEELPWLSDDSEDNADMWATPEESREDILALYRRVCAHSDRTIGSLALDAPGVVPHWPAERASTTLHAVLVHMIAETQRHAGHADIVRELIDGAVGLRERQRNLPGGDAGWWQDYHDRLERVAREVGGR
ncbi:DinB family protein [Saccharomonospora xinjiangensis]|uniref:DinB family protein n=1 Tax=Saccharomonospora xinjiangensis TaxID=75294 RepID=UPI00106F6FDB|nr:DinB family protein [Saccharomonospora xinjiangensis]QBQ60988.1 DinB superfamily protein [Saccharomonospora xinjiangensis]